MKEVQWLKSTPPSPLRDNSRDSYKRCNRVLICFTYSPCDFWESTIAPSEVNYTRVASHSGRCDIASLPPCWLSDIFVGLGQTRETSETRASPVRHTRQCSASCSAAFCHRPMSLCCQHIQLQGALWHVRQRANKEDADRDACALA